jgi:hypothetical protein
MKTKSFFRTLVIPVTIVLLFACQAEQPQTDYEAIGKQYVEMWNTRNFEVFDDILTPDFELVEITRATSFKGKENFMSYVNETHAANPGFKVELLEVIHNPELGGGSRFRIQTRGPLGYDILVDGLSFFHVSDGKISKIWNLTDVNSWNLQMGYTWQPPQVVEE